MCPQCGRRAISPSSLIMLLCLPSRTSPTRRDDLVGLASNRPGIPAIILLSGVESTGPMPWCAPIHKAELTAPRDKPGVSTFLVPCRQLGKDHVLLTAGAPSRRKWVETLGVASSTFRLAIPPANCPRVRIPKSSGRHYQTPPPLRHPAHTQRVWIPAEKRGSPVKRIAPACG